VGLYKSLIQSSLVLIIHKELTYVVVESSKILTPHPPLHAASMPSPRTKAGGTHSPGGGGGGVNILEDARHRIGLLQYNLSTLLSNGCVVLQEQRAHEWLL
jgi:hypothetical protein